MKTAPTSRLLIQQEGILVAPEDGQPAPPWAQEHYRDFHEFLCSASRPHPCSFSVVAEKRQEACRYSYVNSDEMTHALELARTLRAFQALAPSLGGRPALIVFVDIPPTLDAAEQEATFWSLLRLSLHDHDDAPRPATIPADSEHPLWQFCFAGEPWFINGHGTAYQKRLSRGSKRGMFLVYARPMRTLMESWATLREPRPSGRTSARPSAAMTSSTYPPTSRSTAIRRVASGNSTGSRTTTIHAPGPVRSGSTRRTGRETGSG